MAPQTGRSEAGHHPVRPEPRVWAYPRFGGQGSRHCWGGAPCGIRIRCASSARDILALQALALCRLCLLLQDQSLALSLLPLLLVRAATLYSPPRQPESLIWHISSWEPDSAGHDVRGALQLTLLILWSRIAGLRQVRPGGRLFPAWFDIFPNSERVQQVEAPVCVLHVRASSL